MPGSRHRGRDISEAENLTLSSLRQFTRAGCLSCLQEQQAARQFAGSLQVKAPHLEAPIAALSGGRTRSTPREVQQFTP